MFEHEIHSIQRPRTEPQSHVWAMAPQALRNPLHNGPRGGYSDLPMNLRFEKLNHHCRHQTLQF
jgi:hypothetical protein